MFKKIIISIFLIMSFLPVSSAQNLPIITNTTPNLSVVVSRGAYNGQPGLIISLKEGKIPVNAPASRVKLYSGEENGYKVFDMLQVAPGKYTTMNEIIIDEAGFVLRILGSKRIKDVTINFKTKPKETPTKSPTKAPPTK